MNCAMQEGPLTALGAENPIEEVEKVLENATGSDQGTDKEVCSRCGWQQNKLAAALALLPVDLQTVYSSTCCFLSPGTS